MGMLGKSICSGEFDEFVKREVCEVGNVVIDLTLTDVRSERTARTPVA